MDVGLALLVKSGEDDVLVEQGKRTRHGRQSPYWQP